MPTAMNLNPYPQGRWTQFASAIAAKKSQNRLLPKPVAVDEQVQLSGVGIAGPGSVEEAEPLRRSGLELFARAEASLCSQAQRQLAVA